MDTSESNTQRIILFDLDGTLVDTCADICWAINALLSELGQRAVPEDAVRLWIGNGVTALVEQCLAATGANKQIRTVDALGRFLDHYEEHLVVSSRLYPGVSRTLSQLAANGFRLGVCTNKPTFLAIRLLNALGIGRVFDAIVGGDAVNLRKPHPEHLCVAIAEIAEKGRRIRAMMVGDSANDVLAARAAGVPVVVARHGYSQLAPDALKADYVIGSFAELPRIANDLLGDGAGHF